MLLLLILAGFFVVNVICDETEPVKDLIGRVMGVESISSFYLKLDNEFPNYFEIYPVSGKIGITASTKIGLSSGFHYYIKNILQGSVTMETRNIPMEKFPILPSSKITKNKLGDFNYLFNVCAFGYTTTAWKFEEWAKLIDWMALKGINFPLAFVGQEYIWYKTFSSFGISLEEMLDFFSGPHFLPWERMGNIQKWGGPVTESFLENRYNLQIKILQRMRELGMKPVLPGFGGFVPPAFVKKFPDVKVSKSSSWGRFNSSYTGTYLVDPLDKMFLQIGVKFYETLINGFGTDHYYNCDTYNEMVPKNNSLIYLSQSSQVVYDAIRTVDKKGVWVMQGWLFYNERYFWTNERIQAYLSSVPNDRMIILDLYSEILPVWKECQSYFEKPYIWNILKNFGGHRGLWGDINELGRNAISDYHNKSSTMVGFGITSEAIYLPPMMYEFFVDLYLYENPLSPDDVDKWLKQYIISRYGLSENSKNSEDIFKAWNALRWGPYAHDDGEIVWRLSVLEYNPEFGLPPYSNSTFYSLTAEAFRYFVLSGISGSNFTDGYYYDYVDTIRQFLANLVNDIYSVFQYSFDKKRFGSLKIYGDEILRIINVLDRLLLSNEHFLLGTWIQDARDLGTTVEESNMYEFNARNQLTLWGPLNAGVGGDYARKQWNGLVGRYYYNRWKIFLDAVISNPSSFDPTKTQQIVDDFAVSWQTKYEEKYPTKPEGNCFEIAENEIFKNYGFMPENYEIHKATDAVGKDIGPTYTTDVVTLANLCNLDPDCEGFNTNGWMKFSVDVTSSSNVDLYVKKGIKKK